MIIFFIFILQRRFYGEILFLEPYMLDFGLREIILPCFLRCKLDFRLLFSAFLFYFGNMIFMC
jgi:hypothetical protein